jgi:hypothetical protein
MADELVDIGLDWQSLSVDDMKLVMDQADALSSGFPERPGVEGIFSIITSAAVLAMYSRGAGSEVIGRAHTDESAPFDQQIDDIGVAMAHVMPIVEDQSLPAAVRGLWNAVLRSLSAEIRSRQRRR